MRLITRYILAEFLKVFLLSLSGITLIVLMAVVGQISVREGLSPENVLRLIPFGLPIALLYAIPATTLFAACSVYGRVSAANEVVAMKSAGISPLALIWPVLALSFLLSVLVVGLNDLAVRGREGFKRVVLDSVEQIAYGMLRKHHSYRSPDFSISVTSVVEHTLIRPTMTWHKTGDELPLVITAEEAEMSANLEDNALRITLMNSEMDYGDKAISIWPGKYVMDVPLSEATHKPDGSRGPSGVALARIGNEVDKQHAEVAQLEEELAAEAAYQLLTGDFDDLQWSEWSDRHTQLRHARTRLHRLHTEPWRRWANGFSCLAFVLVGAPLAIRLRNADTWTTFGLCFGILLVVYYPLLAYGVDQAKSGELPPYFVWLGNGVLAFVGMWLINRVMRY